ncbi:bifunctional hydroxymethylpyrimidine kinase/phosphomethylpyrimidine kinase [Weissella viridescens]|uniref:bifunctional hydroxymethylpyrimidine kinase/phosphomethylpyrimidine kinase n=1 Tax=Weissella viridescens TaxID=1629 RepID=UPI001D0889F6|nr:bifunctional hydroxymethylpyrimidine kinase/phosphomethylpyrimidine kinase [Weissella viridescens]MCB6840739.1 bifunctional hydroxymethylpyrimidine kinase/phosphomethylpyrimidine kinase [Weissella viridescens]MCB6847472.1 bifunctional hydroxymethylpyrimidine kinase/phosphomethylpyrimidine kinase [Weissella viridescens]WJI91263.1 bifunctional hydroxymethylpyrimidine kinase/phosphomethylpyrimidine kinase [Weissella viridescens]
MVNSFPQVVTIAGNDSDGSAGGPADLHTFFARDTYGMMILTAAVAGNSYGIQDQRTMPLDFITQQFTSIADDFEIRAAKTGMLADRAIIHNVVENLNRVSFGDLVVDPVISTKHGATLLEMDAIKAVQNELLPLATITTPNIYEGELLADMSIDSPDDMEVAARKIQSFGAKNVLLKGRHADAKQLEVTDLLLLENGETHWLTEPYVDTTHINGTGDTLSSVIVAELAKGQSILEAVKLAKTLTYQAIAETIEVGHQFGPINIWAAQDKA